MKYAGNSNLVNERDACNILGHLEHLLIVEKQNKVLCKNIKNEMSKIGYGLVFYNKERSDAELFLSKNAYRFLYVSKDKPLHSYDLYNAYVKLEPYIRETWRRRVKALGKVGGRNRSLGNRLLCKV